MNKTRKHGKKKEIETKRDKVNSTQKRIIYVFSSMAFLGSIFLSWKMCDFGLYKYWPSTAYILVSPVLSVSYSRVRSCKYLTTNLYARATCSLVSFRDDQISLAQLANSVLHRALKYPSLNAHTDVTCVPADDSIWLSLFIFTLPPQMFLPCSNLFSAL